MLKKCDENRAFLTLKQSLNKFNIMLIKHNTLPDNSVKCLDNHSCIFGNIVLFYVVGVKLK